MQWTGTTSSTAALHEAIARCPLTEVVVGSGARVSPRSRRRAAKPRSGCWRSRSFGRQNERAPVPLPPWPGRCIGLRELVWEAC